MRHLRGIETHVPGKRHAPPDANRKLEPFVFHEGFAELVGTCVSEIAVKFPELFFWPRVRVPPHVPCVAWRSSVRVVGATRGVADLTRRLRACKLEVRGHVSRAIRPKVLFLMRIHRGAHPLLLQFDAIELLLRIDVYLLAIQEWSFAHFLFAENVVDLCILQRSRLDDFAVHLFEIGRAGAFAETERAIEILVLHAQTRPRGNPSVCRFAPILRFLARLAPALFHGRPPTVRGGVTRLERLLQLPRNGRLRGNRSTKHNPSRTQTDGSCVDLPRTHRVPCYLFIGLVPSIKNFEVRQACRRRER
mmetsp:Transcript_11966/g.32359  ORF Transcript_11966/g.32359 Transcript_11966/m.32359 type:complete len:305 (-) Transcript_11966:1173-2087(-)